MLYVLLPNELFVFQFVPVLSSYYLVTLCEGVDWASVVRFGVFVLFFNITIAYGDGIDEIRVWMMCVCVCSMNDSELKACLFVCGFVTINCTDKAATRLIIYILFVKRKFIFYYIYYSFAFLCSVMCTARIQNSSSRHDLFILCSSTESHQTKSIFLFVFIINNNHYLNIHAWNFQKRDIMTILYM